VPHGRRETVAAAAWRSGIALATSTRVAKRILVVDDEAYLRDVHVLVLRDAGYGATALETATEALERLAEIRPDLIVLDVSLPGLDGRQFLRWLRASPPWEHVPVIVSSGFAGDEIEALSAPGTEVLTKPFSDVALLTRVRRLIGDA
jgi:CheY-like chemotaxis protein